MYHTKYISASFIWATLSVWYIMSDFLKDCMSDPALVQKPLPIDQFSRMFCVVCGQKECSRSRSNTMVFTERVANWKDRMFDKVPRASDNDENYIRIRAKNFQNIEPAMSIETKKVVPIELNDQKDEINISTKIDQIVEPKIVEIEKTRIIGPGPEPIISNTPFFGGVTLAGKPVDKNEDELIEVGGSFVFGEQDE